MAHTDRQTSGHGHSMTNLAQWGRVGENLRKPGLFASGILQVLYQWIDEKVLFQKNAFLALSPFQS